jgi:hypothetical protein
MLSTGEGTVDMAAGFVESRPEGYDT